MTNPFIIPDPVAQAAEGILKESIQDEVEWNIGLNVTNGDNSKEAVQDRAKKAWRVLQLYSHFYFQSRVAQSTTEPTLVVHMNMDPKLLDTVGNDLSNYLHQDCVAVYNVTTGEGKLIGPRAAAWGEFNPAYFIRWKQ